MTPKNLAIVWAPNLIRPAPPAMGSTAVNTMSLSLSSSAVSSMSSSPQSSPGFPGHRIQQDDLVRSTRIVQYLIDNAGWLFEGRDDQEEEEEARGKDGGQNVHHGQEEKRKGVLRRASAD